MEQVRDQVIDDNTVTGGFRSVFDFEMFVSTKTKIWDSATDSLNTGRAVSTLVDGSVRN